MEEPTVKPAKKNSLRPLLASVRRLLHLRYDRITIVAIAALVIFINLNKSPWNRGRVIHNDIISYYCYLPAAIIHKDLQFKFVKDDPDFWAGKYWPLKTQDGRNVIKMSMGLALLYLPFFLIAHAIALIGGFSADGYSTPYQIMLQLSALFYLVVALMVLRRVLAKWFTPSTIAIVLLSTVVGTNMLYYSSLEATMSHVYNFFLYALFFSLTVKFWEQHRFKRWVQLGLLVGIISLVRPTNAVIILFFLLWGINSWATVKARVQYIISHWHLVMLALALAFSVWIPQLLYWKAATGQWIYYSYNNEGFFFQNPHILDGLFSYRKGWLTYSPIMVFPLIGIAVLAVQRRWEWFWSLAVFTLVNMYVIFSWWAWWYGGGLGARPLIESYALLTLPFAHIVAWLNSTKKRQVAGYIAIVMLGLYGTFTNWKYYYQSIHWDSMTKEAYWDSFLRLTPSGRLNFLLQSPDYDGAIVGQERFIPRAKYQSIAHRIIFENTCSDTTEGACMRHARSGKFAVKVNKWKQYVLTSQLTLKPNQNYVAYVWRYGNPNAMLVVDDGASSLYKSTKTTVDIDSNGWELLTIEFTTPQDAPSIKLYAWNKNYLAAYFDDLVIGEVLEQ